MKPDVSDLLAFVGWVLIGFGLGSVSVPLALCVCGGLLLAAGVVGAWRKGVGRESGRGRS